jgi:hypothetical protein
MRQVQRFGLVAVMGAAVMALAIASPASARKFQMSGSWFVRNGQVFIPLQFAATAMGTGMQMTHVSMGNLTGAYFFPNGPVPGLGGVTAQGTSPASIMVPMHRFVQDVMAAVPLSGINLIQITTNFGVDAPYNAGTLAAGNGPGSFTWCPGDAACTGVGWPNPLATDPPQGAGRNGRMIYAAGPNQYGGVIQMGLARGGIVSVPFGTGSPMRVGHVKFGGAGNTLRNLAPGGLGSPDNPATEMVYLAAGFVTQPTMFPPMGQLILNPGPKVTTMFGLTNTGTGATFYLPVIAVGPMGTQAGQFTSNYGFAHTTGTVLGQATAGTGGQDFFTFPGSNNLTPLGAGNISTIAGGISFRNTVTSPTGTPYASLHKISMTLGAPIPSMSPAGFAAAGALMLLGVGYALRRRLK